MSKRETEEQFKRLTGERRPFEELRQAAKARPIEKPKEPLVVENIDFNALITDEHDAEKMYSRAANRIERIYGFAEADRFADTFRMIAREESRHAELIEDMIPVLKAFLERQMRPKI